MENSDIELAKAKLTDGNLSLVIAKNGQVIFETEKRGIGGFLQAIDKLDKQLVAASVADKVIGMATAMLCAYSGVASVFALTISEGAARVLDANNISYGFETKVSSILNRDKSDICPFEKLAVSSKDPNDAYLKVKALAHKMMLKAKNAACD